ncbi:MAG: hypothetical protein ACLQDY_12555 [Streptosporangiaceae bacterium]
MTHQSQPRRVSPGEISDLLGQLDSHMSPAAAAAARLAFFDRKADLLTRIANDLDTDEARAVAANACARAAELRAALGTDSVTGVA